jgi:hypothetical protein
MRYAIYPSLPSRFPKFRGPFVVGRPGGKVLGL